MAAVILDGRSLDAKSVERVADGEKVVIDEGVRPLLAKGRRVVEQHIQAGIPVYGLNTGLGARAGQMLDPAALADFSVRMVRGRAQGVGAPLSPREVRAVIVTRLNTLLSGAAGASPGIADHLAEILNRDIVPVMPRHASIGAGDLVAMAALPHALIGEGEILVSGERKPALDVLRSAGLAPLALKPKDGQVLCSSTAFSVGLAALAAARARRAVTALQIAGALSFVGFRGNRTPFAVPATRIRPQPGEIEAGDELLALTDFGAGDYKSRRFQDPLSFRCMPQVHGAAYAEAARLEAALAVELNSVADNPVVLLDEERIIGTSNFHMPHLTLALDGMARALALAATDSVSRIARLMSAGFSELPPLLSSGSADRAGFGPLMKPAEALRAEIIHLSHPVPILPSHNADGQEDAATFSALAAQKLGELLDRLDLLTAFELLAGAQAVDLAGLPELPAKLAPIHASIRAISPFIDDDRPLGREIERIARELVRTGELLSLAPQA
ncbi:aromatic amino acid lyase [Nordella sp. HKS 07]|uniref:HAL/PAL/TAL family ammonia-lyase n=1 Tax=Nordella sp. HKS 07 TaxID=2712222 RepID=UPI0013E14014|nr:aromatic amino acid ammonia-lyase [Nordella sp. HKS 07]QIG47525.1 aromatic amino acid lyase [Nordella sp. HKS 07]